MMRLLYWPTCPYACKVMGVLAATGLESRVEMVPMHPWETDSPLWAHNPLHKVPVLIDEQGDYFYDSGVICDYLDHRHKGDPLIPRTNTPARWEILRLQALGDGLCDAALSKLLEENVRVPKIQSRKWIARQQKTVEKSLDSLEKQCPVFHHQSVNVGLLSVSAALAYLSYRFGGESWRGTHPRLSTWHSGVVDLPPYSATVPIESEVMPEHMENLNA